MATTLFEVSMSLAGDQSLPLTMQERRALELSATGLDSAEVADAMGVSPEMVREWLTSAIRKLGARSKLEAVRIAARRGDLDLPL